MSTLLQMQIAKLKEELATVKAERDAVLAEVDRLNHWQENYANEQQQTLDQQERDLLSATNTGMALILSTLGAYKTLSPYMQAKYDRLEKLHAKCDRAFEANTKANND